MDRLAQCRCGSLRATTAGDPLLVNMCHCRDCQRRTGSVVHVGAIFRADQVTVEGDSKLFEREGQEGRKVRLRFCPTCGTTVYWTADIRPGWCFVAVGAFADPSFPAPSVSIYEESKHPWLPLPEGLRHAQRGLA